MSTLGGCENLISALNKNKDLSPDKLIKSVGADVERFIQNQPQFDDFTMLCIHYKGTTVKELTIEAAVENIDVVNDFVADELKALGCPKKAQIQIRIAIDELFGNIAKYAYSPDVGKATVRFEVEEAPLSVIITFIDNGKPFNPLKQADPDIHLSAPERNEGGLGIFLVKKTMNLVEYEYKNGQNILKIKKNISQ